MKKILLFSLFLLPVIVKAQKSDTLTKTGPEKFLPVDVAPEFPGGLEKMIEYFHKNEKVHGNDGVVRIAFIVEKDGSLSNITIIKSLSDSADKEAIRLISQSPKWVPAMQGGHPVPSNYTIPVYFPAM